MKTEKAPFRKERGLLDLGPGLPVDFAQHKVRTIPSDR